MVFVEKKEFLVDWTGVQGRILVAVTERSKKRVVHGFLLKDCVMWLVPVLRKFASAVLLEPPPEVAKLLR